MATTTPTTPQTLLEAVNQLLQAIRVSGVMSLNAADINQNAADAKQALDNAAREIQLIGWEFNTEYGQKIDPALDGSVTLPSNTLKVRSARCTSGTRLTQRGSKLYNNRGKGYNIGETVEAELVVALSFEDLPEAFKRWVTALAARRFCIPKLPSGSTFAFTEEYLQMAEVAARQSDEMAGDETLPQTSPHFARMGRR